jgi:hypothetical protein
VLNCAGLDGLPHFLVVAGLKLGLALSLEADLWGWGRRAGARGSGGRDAGGVEDGVGLVHLLVMLLDGLPRLGDVALRLLGLLRCGGGLARAVGCGDGSAWGVGGLVGSVEGVVVGLCVSRNGGEDVGWHFEVGCWLKLVDDEVARGSRVD